MIFKSLLLFILMNTILFAQVHKFDMTIEEGTKEVAPNLKYKVWGFNGQVPGPLIHVKEGDDLEVTVLNKTSLPHTIHWHGVLQKNTWKMDGVPNVTQEAIEPGDTFTYKFKADKPGTLWYHCHVNVAEHVGLRGMWGLLIVDPKDPIAIENEVNKEVTLTTEQQLLLVRMPCRLRGTYITWLLGFDPYFLMSRETYYRHAEELATKYGIEIRKKSPYYQSDSQTI